MDCSQCNNETDRLFSPSATATSGKCLNCFRAPKQGDTARPPWAVVYVKEGDNWRQCTNVERQNWNV